MQTRTLPGRMVDAHVTAKAAPVAVTRAAAPAAKFVYTGNTGLTVVSPITGKRYRFDRPGAVLDVDPRDRSWMSFVPNLKAV